MTAGFNPVFQLSTVGRQKQISLDFTAPVRGEFVCAFSVVIIKLTLGGKFMANQYVNKTKVM